MFTQPKKLCFFFSTFVIVLWLIDLTNKSKTESSQLAVINEEKINLQNKILTLNGQLNKQANENFGK